MKKTAVFACLLCLTGCMKPLYESDYPLYRQYKYWESSDKDWQDIDYFQILSFRMRKGSKTALRLVPQRNGLPSTATGYIQAAQKAAFNLMTETCGTDYLNIKSAVVPEKGRKIDRFFYQFGDASIGVTFACRPPPPHRMDLEAEQQKWSMADRNWDQIDNIRAYVDTLPPAAGGRRQIRIRLFGGTIFDNKRLARRIIQNTCPNTNFRILSDKAGVDIVPAGHKAEVVSEDNVRIYDFNCTP